MIQPVGFVLYQNPRTGLFQPFAGYRQEGSVPRFGTSVPGHRLDDTWRQRGPLTGAPPLLIVAPVKLVRRATLTFTTKSAEWRAWSMSIGNVRVRTLGYGERDDSLTVAVVAEVPLMRLPMITTDNRVEVPEDARRETEAAIESVANLIAVFENCRRSISSPHPCVAFLPAEPTERGWLDNRAGIAIPARFNVVNRIRLNTPHRLLGELRDRLGGVALLAEALSHTHATGRFHELVRFFENAFALSYNQLEKRLAQFLSGTSLGYTRAEVRRWLQEVRDLATHADRRPDFALEADTRPIVDRMEQAAYDVLFNKRTWRDRSSERREVWKPEGATAAEMGKKLVLVQGSTPPALEAQLLDVFCSYPMDLTRGLPTLPEEWWFGNVDKGRARSEPADVVVGRP